MNNLPKVVREAVRPGLEPATYWLQVRRPNHYAITHTRHSYRNVGLELPKHQAYQTRQPYSIIIDNRQ